jgi:hypothetical protein
MTQQSKISLDTRGQQALFSITEGYLQREGITMETQSLTETISQWWTANGVTVDDTKNIDWITKIVEDTLLFLTGLYLAHDYKHRLLAYVNYVKASLGERPLLASSIFNKIEELFKETLADEPYSFEFQSMNNAETFVDSARELLDNFDAFKNKALFKKSYKLIGYIVSMNIFGKLDMEFTRSAFNVVEGEWKKKTWGGDFALTVLDMILFVLKRGIQSVRTGTIDPFFYSGSTCEEWAEKAYEHIKFGEFLQDPEAHGIVLPKYLKELDDIIVKGKSIAKHCVDKFEKRQIMKLLGTLDKIKNNEVAFDAALRDRESPLGVLIFGGTSIAKSTFMNMLYHYVATLKGLPTTSEYKYTRNAIDEFWNNFRSHHHTLVVDDAGYMHPEIAKTGDPSVLELLQAINNICFMPRQAAIDDKGRTPFRCQLVLVSTNTIHLNVNQYFACPLAVLRRIPIVLDICPKPEYLRDGQFIDSAKIPEFGDEEYPDLWTIKVMKVVPEPNFNTDPRVGQRGKFVLDVQDNGEPCIFGDIYKFLKWFGSKALDHEQIQKKYMRTNDCSKIVTLCEGCHVPVRHCQCVPVEELNIGNEASNLVGDIIQDATIPDLMYPQAKFTKEDAVEVLCDRKLGEPFNPTHIERMFRYDEDKANAVLDSIYWDRLSQAHASELKKEAERIANRSWFDKQMSCVALFIASILCDDTTMSSKIMTWFLTRVLSFDTWMVFCFWYSDNKFTTKQAFHAIGNRIALRLGTTPRVLLMITAATTIISGVGLAFAFWKIFSPKPENKTKAVVMEDVEKPKKIQVIPWYDERVCKCDLCNATNAHLVYVHANDPVEGCLCRLCHRRTLMQKVEDLKDSKPQSLTLEQLKLKGSAPIPREIEPEDAWPRGSFQLSTYELSPLSTSLKMMPREEFENNFLLRNLRRFTVLTQKNEKEDYASKAMCLGLCDFLYAFPTHTIPKGRFRLRIEGEPYGNITTNKVMMIEPEQVLCIDHDFTVVKIIGLPPVRNITRLFSTCPIPGVMHGRYIGIDADLCVKHIDCDKIYFTRLEATTYDMMGYMALIPMVDNTRDGDCGMPLYVQTSMGPVVLGFHALGLPDKQEKWAKVGVQVVTLPMVEKAVAHFGGLVVDVETVTLSEPGYPIVVSDVHRKSPVNFLEEGEGEVVTGLLGVRPGPKSKVVKTVISDKLKSQGMTTDMVPPSKMKSYLPWYVALKARMEPKIGFSVTLMDCASEAYLKDVLSGLGKEPLKEVHVYDLFTAINGAAGVQHINSIDKNTSMGFPYRKVKKHFLSKDESGYLRGLPEAVQFTPEIEEKVRAILDRYIDGKMVNPVFSANLKDEVISMAKDSIGKIRVFTGAPVSWVLVVRMMLLWVARLMQTHNYVFEAASGMNAQSDDWDILFRYLTYFGRERIVAGDYKGFDTGIHAYAIVRAFWVLIQIAKEAGMSPEELQIIYGISVDTAYNVVDWNGTILRFMGGIPSGHPLTLLINSIINSLYMRCVYIELNSDHEAHSFKENVHLITLGDDNVCGVSETAEWFNHTAIQEVFAKVGITYTMADKTSESKPFIDISEVTFAKRGWRFDEELQRYMCVLEEASIMKSLHWRKNSGQVSDKAAAVDSVAGAMREYWYYGRDVYEKKRVFFQNLILEMGLDPYVDSTVFRSYDYWVHVYFARSELKDRTHFWLKDVKYLSKSEIPGLREEVVETKTSPEIIFTARELEGAMLGNESVDDFCNLPGRSPKSPKNGDDAGWSSNKEAIASGNCVDPVSENL